jgi:5-methylcytosine-specific restriction protein B
MSRYHPGRDPAPTLNAARRWGECCLVAEGSIFDDQAKLWTPPLLDELDHLFVQNYDEGEGSFIQKLKGQLEPGSPQCRKLMAEALWILMLFQSRPSEKSGHGRVVSLMTSIRCWTMRSLGTAVVLET